MPTKLNSSFKQKNMLKLRQKRFHHRRWFPVAVKLLTTIFLLLPVLRKVRLLEKVPYDFTNDCQFVSGAANSAENVSVSEQKLGECSSIAA